MRKFLIGLAVILLAGGVYYGLLVASVFGDPPGPGVIEGQGLPAEAVADKQQRQSAAGVDQGQILFGDLHVHTTYSSDAFLWSLPINGGEGAHPIGDACDYARYCANLDFWAITDHAAALTPRKWKETKASMRTCQSKSGSETAPDLISLTGYEWTQVGNSVENHYGHKNVIFRELGEDDVTKRPIAAGGLGNDVMRTLLPELPAALMLADFKNQKQYQDFNMFLRELRAMPACDPNVPRDQWPENCYEEVNDPGTLVSRIEEEGLNPLLIPHGTTWGIYTPPGTKLDKQLKPEMRPEAFPIMEIMSGHGNSEEYRPWRAVNIDKDGTATCPEPTEAFLPQCWQAGEVIRKRCEAEGADGADCDQRAAFARNAFVEMKIAGVASVPGADYTDWLDSDQCRDCFLPSFAYRPGGSVQYGLAISNFDRDADKPLRNRWAFIASSDNHRARPGTGYKPVDRMNTTESNGPISPFWKTMMAGGPVEKPARAINATQQQLVDSGAGINLADFERGSSFFTTGGLAAVHAPNRSRNGLWDGLDRRAVYGTSGPRILLWFDLVDGDQRLAMGGETRRAANPTFEVRAVGSFKQKPGCPDYAMQGLSQARLAELCANECYNPSDERRLITRIEVIRIRPQAYEGEPVDGLIEDVWKSLPCAPDPAGCKVQFSDEDFATDGRDSLYYVRAIEEPSDKINGGNLRCTRDSDGNCIKIDPCFGDYRTDREDACATKIEQRAWSSPIFVDYEKIQ